MVASVLEQLKASAEKKFDEMTTVSPTKNPKVSAEAEQLKSQSKQKNWDEMTTVPPKKNPKVATEAEQLKSQTDPKSDDELDPELGELLFKAAQKGMAYTAEEGEYMDSLFKAEQLKSQAAQKSDDKMITVPPKKNKQVKVEADKLAKALKDKRSR